MQPQTQSPYQQPLQPQATQPQMQAAPPAPTSLSPLQEIINRITQVNNVLITVKANPSVDELAAALGLTIALDHSGKHSTVVFSGKVPDVMSFLNPERIIEKDVHSLRDFIISLNKDKADKLRFAKDGEIVKIYITPYKSTITSKDLGYGEGDFNVELVLAIGINNKEELDSVIAAHGRILHDATVATITPGSEISQLGSINWTDVSYSSASAMALTLLQNLNLPSGVSPEVATALLTGLVADTDRFSNAKTTPKVMELAAELMSAGANHQLVTSSVGNLASQNQKLGDIQSSKQKSETPLQGSSEDLTLELHQQDRPVRPEPLATQPPQNNNTRVAPPPARNTATNTAPMANNVDPSLSKAAQNQVSSQANINQQLSQDLSTLQSSESPTSNPSSISSTPDPAPPPFTTSQAEPTSPQDTVTPPPKPLGSQPVSSNIDKKAEVGEADKIKSEIDAAYSSQPFDPANNPRQDYGSDLVLPSEPNINSSVEPTPQVDTTVQKDQHQESKFNAISPPELKPIQTTKESPTSSDELLGNSPIPGLEMPPDITPPPPPPPPPKTPTIETKPTSYPVDSFGNQLNFDPSKPQTSNPS